MENFIRHRLNDRRFNSQPVVVRTGHEVTRWAPIQKTSVSRVNASATMKHDAYKKDSSPKKKKRKTDEDKSDHDSDSDSDDGKKKDKEAGKAEDDPCWKGYRKR